MFTASDKEIHTGYGTKYQQNKEEIDSDLFSGGFHHEISETSFITTHIRQTILKYGDRSIKRLKDVGIELREEDINTINNTMSQLSIPLEVCTKNRYWDPFVLNRIFLNKEKYEVPTNHMDSNFVNKLSDTLVKFNQDFPTHFKKYHVDNNSATKPFYSLSILTDNWMKEKSLHDILDTPYYSNIDRINNTIKTIQNTISYGLPMLLKPLYDIKNSECMILRFIEMGAFNAIPRKMIEMNIPRETALFLSKKFFPKELNANISQEQIIERLRYIAPNLSDWNKIQIEHLL